MKMKSLKCIEFFFFSNFSVSDFNNHLKGNNKSVLDTILTVIKNKEALNSLEPSEVATYLEHVDRYLDALERYRKYVDWKYFSIQSVKIIEIVYYA